MKQQGTEKLIVVIGPTASGKSEYAIKLARTGKGEIISADSQQVYKSASIGTGKVKGTWKQAPGLTKSYFMYKNITHHCIDFVSPRRQYTVADFKREGQKALADIVRRGKTPIICGGTGQYVDALIMNEVIPQTKPNLPLRARLEKKTTAALFSMLKKKDPCRAETIDSKNPRRLIRALEIIMATGKPIPIQQQGNLPDIYEQGDIELPIEIHHLNPPRQELYQRIEKRFTSWLKEGLIQEVTHLHQQGISWKRIERFGLEYKYVSLYVRGKISLEEMKERSIREIKHYAKRQQTWFKKYEEK